MTDYEEVADVFEKVTVWYDDPAELFFYRWAWERIAPILDTDDTALSRVEAVVLAYIYAELCFYVCDENFCEDLLDRTGEFAEGLELEIGFLIGRTTDEDECPTSDGSAVRLLVRANYGRVVAALKKIDALKVLTAFHASYAKPKRVVADEDGDETEEDLIADYETFVRYVEDADFRDEDEGGMSMSDYVAAYEWWGNGAEMLDARTAS